MVTDRYRPQLDGLRAVAVAAVAWSHWERPYQYGIPFGAGVHLFFVLSGFLITSILLDLRAHADRLGAVRAFYIRRALRIFPAFYLTLALAWVGNVTPIRETWGWHAAYLSNLLVFATETWPGSLSHLWSLAVEEQFYVIWPWLIVFAPRRWVVPAIVGAIVSAPMFRGVLAAAGYRETLLAVLTPGCLDSLGMGALLAVARATSVAGLTSLRDGYGGPPKLQRSRKPRATATIASAALPVAAAWIALLVAEANGVVLPLAVMAIKQTLQAVVFAWLVLRAADGFDGVAGRLLSAPPVVYIGKISYGIYLVHGFAGELLASVGITSRSIPEPWRLLVLMAVTVGLAAISWHLIEYPINRLKAWFPYAKATERNHPIAQSPIP